MKLLGNQFKKSKPVILIPYQQRWSKEFLEIAQTLRSVLGSEALRIDHIGSTSIEQMPAKDIIDVQITISSIDNAEQFNKLMLSAGYRQRGEIRFDSVVGVDEHELRKLYYREKEGNRRVHMHVREQGSLNQKYPLLFRDYLRENESTRSCYALLKYRMAEIFPEQIDGYLYIKDPVMDIIFEGAKSWARQVDWLQDKQYL